MQITGSIIKPYNIDTAATETEVLIAGKVVNREYISEASSNGDTFYPSDFSIAPSTTGEKILWGSPELKDGTSSENRVTYNSEDYTTYGSQYQVDDTDITLGNVVNAQTVRRNPFYVNGFKDGLLVTNVKKDAVLTNCTTSGTMYKFNVTGIDASFSACTIRFPNGYIANCVSNGSNSITCYTFNDSYSKEAIFGDNGDDYLKRSSVFPSLGFKNYVAPFYSVMNMAYIDDSDKISISARASLADYSYNVSVTATGEGTATVIDSGHTDVDVDVNVNTTQSSDSKYIITITINNKIGADKYTGFKIFYNERLGNSQPVPKTSTITATISGSSNSCIGYITPSMSGWTITDVTVTDYKLNGSWYTYATVQNQQVTIVGRSQYALLECEYGYANGGISLGGKHVCNKINNTRFDSITSKFNAGYTSQKVRQLHGPVGCLSNLSEFSYELQEGICRFQGEPIETIEISGAIDFSVFPTITFDGSKLRAPVDSECRFFTSVNLPFFKFDSTYGYPVIIGGSLVPSSSTQITEPSWGTEITVNIKSTTGYTYTPSQTSFIVGIYETYDDNAVSDTNRRVKSRLIKVYRNYEFEYTGI